MQEIKGKQESSAKSAVCTNCGHSEFCCCNCVGRQFVPVEKEEVEE
jgi:hypothetical protein